MPPIELPDAAAYTQAEVPKVYEDPAGGYLMLLSTCDRLREDQPDEEVSKEMRLYQSATLDGPWAPWSPRGAVLPGARHLFGGSLMAAARDRLTVLAPYTEWAPPARRMTFAPPRTLDLSRADAA